ncbi:hypothetical protein A1351_11765 [Methylosinus sp. R-45379]|nr:hypothetical protein A1351_11765 [Methylosinus sp. R-45379]
MLQFAQNRIALQEALLVFPRNLFFPFEKRAELIGIERRRTGISALARPTAAIVDVVHVEATRPTGVFLSGDHSAARDKSWWAGAFGRRAVGAMKRKRE